MEKAEEPEEKPEETTEAAGVEEEIAPAQPEEETEAPKEITAFQKQVIDKLKLIENIVGSMVPDKSNWDKVNDMLRETIHFINKSTF